jgi:hypothetical protein
MCLSRRWKADSISFGSCIRTLASLTYHMAQKPDRTTAIQAVNYMSRTKAGLQNAVTTEPYIKMSHMSNQRKAEFVGDIFHMRSFWGGHGENFAKSLFYAGKMVRTRTSEDAIFDIPERSVRHGCGQVPSGGAPPPLPPPPVSLEQLLAT